MFPVPAPDLPASDLPVSDLPPAGVPSCLTASDAARRLGVSIKALRLYEQHGLLRPRRTDAGYRIYGLEDMSRAAEVVALRALGLSLAEVARAMDGDPHALGAALAGHEAALDDQLHDLVRKLDKVRLLRADLRRGRMPASGALSQLLDRRMPASVAFALPWPWGGEHFELHDITPLNYLIGSLGSGKTRLARRLAEVLPDAVFLGLDRLEESRATAMVESDPPLRARVERGLSWLVDEGAVRSDALTILLLAFEAEGPAVLVVDMVEQQLDQPTQEALIRYLRQRARTSAQCLFLMTRSSSILDLATVGADETIILCPANHSPPSRVVPYPGAAGYEAVATCLASPEVRARIAREPGTA